MLSLRGSVVDSYASASATSGGTDSESSNSSYIPYLDYISATSFCRISWEGASTMSSSNTTLHYGGSLRASSSTPGLSPRPKAGRGRPSSNGSFQAQKRFEMIARMENAGLPEAAIAPMLGISVPRLRYLKKLPEYLIVRMRITHGIILDNDAKVAEIKEQRKELLVQMLPPALQVLANTLLTQANSYPEKKLQVTVAQDILDRSDIYTKVSRTEVKPVSFFDFEKADEESSRVLAAIKNAPALQSSVDTDTARSFSCGSESLTEEDQQLALSSLEAEAGERSERGTGDI